MVQYLEVTLSYYLRQAANDTITVLISKRSTTTPSLKARDPIWNALLETAMVLIRAENFHKYQMRPMHLKGCLMQKHDYNKQFEKRDKQVNSSGEKIIS